ncbi:MAG: hypothetical protein ACTSQP_02490 [Promethearchaeota archaeon]
MNKFQQLNLLKKTLENAINSRKLNFSELHSFILKNKITDLKPPIESFSTYFDDDFAVEYKIISYKMIYKIVRNYLKRQKNDNLLKNFDFSKRNINNFINILLDFFIFKKYCVDCFSKNPRENDYLESYAFYCKECSLVDPESHFKPVFFKSIDPETFLLPTFIYYIKDWTDSKNYRINNREIHNDFQNQIDFVKDLLREGIIYFVFKGDIESVVLFYEVLRNNKINIPKIRNENRFKNRLIKSLKIALENQNFYDFLAVKPLFEDLFGNIENAIPNISEKILNTMLKSLEQGHFFNFKYIIEDYYKSDFNLLNNLIMQKGLKNYIEKCLYSGLALALKDKNFERFRELIDYSYKFDIFIDISKINNKFSIISDLLISNIYYLGEIINILRFCCEFNILERKLNKKELELVSEIRKNRLIMANLKDLFGNVSNSFILYIKRDLPSLAFEYFIKESNYYFLASEPEQIVSGLLIYFNDYSVYGLSVKKIGTIERFLKKFEQQYEIEKNSRKKNGFNENNIKYLEFDFAGKRHLVSVHNIKKNLNKITSKFEYNFLSLSMVLLGGLGPQGHGFTYSTPEGEVIEVCSDRLENEAIIIKYKKFLKRQFLIRLEKELIKLRIPENEIFNIINFLKKSIKFGEIINYYKKEPILEKIRDFLVKNSNDLREKEKIELLLGKISEAINIILRPIDMVDQFKARMDLIDEGKIQSEDIAKLTSLKDKSHYDVLRERFFFKQIINWFYDIYRDKKSKIK